MIGYEIADKIFYNPFLAFIHGAYHCARQSPRFLANNNVFDRLDWTQEPPESVQQLIDLRSQQLAEKYQRLVLCFSGGTDSITAYNSLMRQGIFIDQILISFTQDSDAHSQKNVEWIMRHHPDRRTQITVFNRYDIEWSSLYQDQDWVLDDHGGYRRFELGAPGPFFYRHCEDRYGKENWCMIVGLEKPHILRDHDQWMAVHLDRIYQVGANWPRMEYFFFSPDLPGLHIKQNHLLLRYIKKKYPQVPNGWSSIAHLGKQSSGDYAEYAQACGCDREVNPGLSFIQKSINRGYQITQLDKMMDGKFNSLVGIEPFLKERLVGQDRRALNYIDGWRSLQSDKVLIDYMMRHKLLHDRSQAVKEYNGMWGRMYPLEK